MNRNSLTILTLLIFLVVAILTTIGCEKEEPAAASTPTITEHKPKAELSHNQKAALKKTLETKKPVKSLPLSAGTAGLKDLIPQTMEGIEKTETPASTTGPGHAHAAFIKDKRSINVNVQIVKDSADAIRIRNERMVKPGEVRELKKASLEMKGFEVSGTNVERIFYTSGINKSEAKVRFGDKLELSVAVQPAKDKDEAVELLKTFDFKMFDAYVSTLP